MNVEEIVATLRKGLGAQDDDPANQGLVQGKADMAVSRVLVCQSPSVGALRAAGAQPGTLVVTREHPFYAHDNTYWSTDVEKAFRDAKDPVLRGKRAVIDGGGLAIYRLSTAWDAARPKAQAQALAEALGWRPGDSGGGRKAVCDITPIQLGKLARQVRDKLDAGHVRVIGAPEATVRRVALLPEFVNMVDARDILAASPAIDGIVCGETTEWEAGPYLKDSFDMRRAPISVIFAGTQPTQEPGVRRMQQWIAQQLSGVPVTFFDIARPVRTLEAR